MLVNALQKPPVQRVVIGIGGVFCTLTLASALGALHWTLDVLTMFNPLYLWVLLVCLLLSVAARLHWGYTLAFGVGLSINGFLLAPFFLPPPPQTSTGAPLTLIALNVSTRNDHYPQITDFLREQNADLVVLTEVRQDLLDHIDATLTDIYPHIYAEPSRMTLGLAWLSRQPFTQTQTVFTEGERRRFLSVQIEWDEQPVTFFSVHPLPPLNTAWAQSRNREFEAFGTQARATQTPLILAGDFNATAWSFPLRRLVQNSALTPSAHGYGVYPTWIVGGVTLAPLDYMLHSPEWEVQSYRVARNVGSDHLPVVAQFRLR